MSMLIRISFASHKTRLVAVLIPGQIDMRTALGAFTANKIAKERLGTLESIEKVGPDGYETLLRPGDFFYDGSLEEASNLFWVAERWTADKIDELLGQWRDQAGRRLTKTPLPGVMAVVSEAGNLGLTVRGRIEVIQVDVANLENDAAQGAVSRSDVLETLNSTVWNGTSEGWNNTFALLRTEIGRLADMAEGSQQDAHNDDDGIEP